MRVTTIRLLAEDHVAHSACSCLCNDERFRFISVTHPEELVVEDDYSPVVLSIGWIDKAPPTLGLCIPLLVLVEQNETKELPAIARQPLSTVLGTESGKLVLGQTLESLRRFRSLQIEIENLAEAIHSVESEIEMFSRIGMALESERDTERLFDLILTYARKVTNADGGSIYIIHEHVGLEGQKEKYLYFANTQSDTLSIPFQGSEMKISEESIAGHVALHGTILNLPDVYKIPEDSPYRFNPDFDRSVHYRTTSVLTLPMRNIDNDIIGILQLINKKRHSGMPLIPYENIEKEVIPFDEKDEQRAMALGGQAAVALENSILYEDIERLLEGFVRASVNAIEARDPVTSGHTERVTQLTLALARAVSEIRNGPYMDVTFNARQMRELRYAGLLHDIGKIGVREKVLTKAQKLFPEEMEVVRQRFDLIRQTIRLEDAEKRLACALDCGKEKYRDSQEVFDRELKEALQEIDDYWSIIQKSNMPKILPGEVSERLPEVAELAFKSSDGLDHAYITDHELHCLSVKKGSLTSEEIAEIRSHVMHTRNFLEKIPWIRTLLGVTQIACGHHEMMNGTGYPMGFSKDDIPVQARIMAIADIYDALTATDRPYKKAVPIEKALNILEDEVEQNRLDGELVRIFRESRVYEQVYQEMD